MVREEMEGLSPEMRQEVPDLRQLCRSSGLAWRPFCLDFVDFSAYTSRQTFGTPRACCQEGRVSGILFSVS